MLYTFIGTAAIVGLLFFSGGNVDCLALYRAIWLQLYLHIVTNISCMFCFSTANCQCYKSTNCTGGEVPAVNKRACCVETNEGFSYIEGGTCTACIGI